MNYLLLCFSCTLSIYSPLQALAWSSEAEKDQPIDDFIDKLLRSDKFDQLASKIAEKAVDRIIKIRSNNATNSANKDLVYRVGKNESNESEKKQQPTEQTTENSNHVSDEITSLLEKRQPFNKLSLKYVKLIEKKQNENVVRTNVKEKSSPKGRAKTNKARVKSDRENDVYGQFYTKGNGTRVKKGKGKAKLKKVKNVTKPKRKRKTTATTKVTKHDYTEKHFKDSLSESIEPTRFNTTAVLISDEVKYYTHIFAHSDERTTTKRKSHKQTSVIAKNDYKNMTDVKTKRILARENDRLYVFASSSDYDDLYIEDVNR